MTFTEIERAREAHRITQVELCRHAGVHPMTYYRLKTSDGAGRVQTINRLSDALERLIACRREAIDATL